MPKLPSLKHLLASARYVIGRFPLELLFALVSTVAATVEVEVKYNHPVLGDWCTRLIMTGNVGLLLNLAVTLFTESRLISPLKKWGLHGLAILLAIVFLLVINPAEHSSGYTRFVLISFALHLLVSFAAFSRNSETLVFWDFNKTLFLRFLAGALYGAVLFAGLSAAIGSMNLLFGFDFEWDTFLILWIWITGMFITLFFLAGVPEYSPAKPAEAATYPKGLKIFTQFVLIPLATVYVVILLTYELKILIQWNLPKGLVSNLILGYAVFGILSLLLIFPIRDQEENKWMRTYSRNFYILLLPLIVLLIVAVLFRIVPYGITVPRYFLLVLAGWLTFITLYFLFTDGRNIRLIPVSLCLFTLFTVYGPQSAFRVAEFSQVKTLQNLFRKHGAFDGRYLKPLVTSKLDSAEKARVRDVSRYIVSEFGLESLQGMMRPDLRKVRDSILKKETDQRAARYMVLTAELTWLDKKLNIPGYTWEEKRADQVTEPRFIKNSPSALSPEGARYILPFEGDSTNLAAGNSMFHITRPPYTNRLTITDGKNRAELNLTALLDTLERVKIKQEDPGNPNLFRAPERYLRTTIRIGGRDLPLHFTTVNYTVEKNGKKLNYLSGYVFVP
ncbi:MAG: DUF4153 domain-containing protein [Mucilaginibacter polytrichastri]|nr:DUF4153 domain-containing protein [Mucilaginibacter polytrichastri]